MAAPPIGGANTPDSSASAASPPNPFKRFPKRKRGYNAKRLQAIEQTSTALNRSLNPIPFRPNMIFNFNKHEKLLKHLGLWDFVHIKFDQNIRADLIVQLVSGYDPRLKCSYVNGLRISVSRADLGRALELNVKKEKGNDWEGESFSDESIEFIESFVLNWVLLHDDKWVMPDEVVGWVRLIKNKHPDQVDWSGLLWFMVAKELWCWEKLRDCYYASHLQRLIRSQREDLMLVEQQPDMAQNNEGFLSSEEPRKAPRLRDNAFANEPEKLRSKGEGHNVEGDEEERDANELNLELTLGPSMKDVEVKASEEYVDEEHGFFGRHCGKNVENEKQITGKEKEEVDDDFAFMHNVEIVVGDIHQASNIPTRVAANPDVKAKPKVPKRVFKRKSKRRRKAPFSIASLPLAYRPWFTAEGTPQQSLEKGGNEKAAAAAERAATSSGEHISNSLHSHGPAAAVLNDRAVEVEEEMETIDDDKLREVEVVLHPERSESEGWAIFQRERIKSLQAQLEEAQHAAKAAEDAAARVTQAAKTAALIAEGKLIIAADSARRAEDRALAAEARAQKAEEASQRVAEHLRKVLQDLEARLQAGQGRCCKCSGSL